MRLWRIFFSKVEWNSMIGALLGPVANLASTWLEGHVAEKKAKTEAKIKERQATGEIDWDIAQAKASAGSWKDEWLTILFSIPLVLAFIPGCEDIVQIGFNQLQLMPDWYKYALSVIVAASFGVRGATKLFKK